MLLKGREKKEGRGRKGEEGWRERDGKRGRKAKGGRQRDGGRGMKGEEEGRGKKGEGRREREEGRGREGHSLYLKQLHIVEEVSGVELENENTVDPRSPPAICVDGERKEPQHYYEPSP